ncbi:hypothetical protein AVEN_253011-1 [Araneus ventricosus]|uniref:Uncharacterized protein n=1 Tax=Araneus ventricosus TaxID=182803 RepID=A0A4Y2F180_ARAVE|nr:hypothetical protein AVEN_253011-1 [Araneus ventricosus]
MLNAVQLTGPGKLVVGVLETQQQDRGGPTDIRLRFKSGETGSLVPKILLIFFQPLTYSFKCVVLGIAVLEDDIRSKDNHLLEGMYLI